MPSAVRPAEGALSRETILAIGRSLPSSPRVLAGLCELLEDPNVDIARIAAEIRFEPSLAARVIRVANSVAFGTGPRLGSVDEAVSRVGFGEVLRLVGAATVTGLVDRSLRCYGIPVTRLRESLLLHALASEALARWTNFDTRTAYSAGLLRGLGLVILDRVARERPAGGNGYDANRFATFTAWEMEYFGISSPEVTAIVLEDGQFPPEVVGAVWNHLEPAVGNTDVRLAMMLNLAGAIVAERGLALPGELSSWTPNEKKFGLLGISDEQFRSASAAALAVFERQRSALG